MPKAASPAPIGAGKVPTTGFCLFLQRVRQEQRAGILHPRTVSDYQCYWQGEAIGDLNGQMVERNGPGDNTATGVTRHLRIEARQYPLAIQDGAYKTYGYAAAGPPLPALALENTGKRTGILLHPCHDDKDGFLSSIGCLNPAIGLKNADSRIDLADSRSRVIAIIEALKLRLGITFPKHGLISGATILIEGEPS
jgi:hypothetical protein